MIRIILLAAGLIAFSDAIGSNPDSSLFNNEFERQSFSLFLENKQIDSIDLFISLDYKPLIQKVKVEEIIAELRSKTGDYAMPKKLKTIYKTVHDKFLVKYTEDAYFNDIFLNGNYNCVTASALYALVLQGLSIDFDIKEKPDHVYIIADPGSSGFLIESTLPAQRLIQFDDRVKTTFVQYLHNNKIISDEEFRNESTEQLFEKHYLKDKNITLHDLAGLHYYNRGVSLFNKAAYMESLPYFEKANLLNKSDLVGFMKNNALINILNTDLQKKKYNGITLAKYMNVNDSNDIGTQYAREYFDAVSSELAVNKPNINAYKAFFSDFSRNLKTNDTADFYRAFYFFLGYNNTINYKYSVALSYLSKSYDFNPDNIATKEMITLAITKSWFTDRNHEQAIDSLNYYLNRFAFLKYDRNMVGYTEYCYAKAIEKLLNEERLDQSTYVLRDMERFLYKYNDFEPNKENVILVYNQIGFYYMIQKKLDEAEQFLRRGLRLVPDAESLKQMLNQIRIMKNGAYEYPEMMSDSKPLKKYLLALAKAKDNADLINENASLYLPGTWKMNTPPEMKMSLRLMAGSKAEVVNETGIKNAVWNFDQKKCILTLSIDQEKKSIHIIVTELLPDRLKGVLYQNEHYENTSEITMVPETNTEH